MSINVGLLAATTLRKRSKTLADNITNNNAVLMRMDEKG
jgi:hypothetical protein